MSLSVSDLKNLIITNLKTVSSTIASDYLTELGNTIANYVKDNADFVFAWVAALPTPPYTPDPVTSANGSFISLAISLTPSNATEQTTALSYLQTEIIAGFTNSTYNITDTGFSTSAGLLSSSPTIASLVISISATTQDEAITQLATQIINYIKAQTPTATCSGSHGSYIGSGTVSTIS